MVTEEERIEQPRARAYFYDFLGNPFPVGRLIKNPAYAATLRKIAAGGAKAFYEREIAGDIVATVTAGQGNPGDMTLADLANYRVKVREPVCGTYRAYRVCGMPLPSSGGPTVLQMLGILEPYDVKAMGPATLWSVHFVSEAGRLAYADRGVYMADPDFFTAPTGLIDRGYLAERSRAIRADASLGRATPGTPSRHCSTEESRRGRITRTSFRRPRTSRSSTPTATRSR